MINTSNTKTTISVSKETRDKLAALCRKEQYFEEIIKELLKKWNEGN